jgi:phage terminase large subunit GpA-like protein
MSGTLGEGTRLVYHYLEVFQLLSHERYNEINNVISKAFRVGSFLVIAGISIATSTSDKANVTAGSVEERSHFREYEERKGKVKKGGATTAYL